MAACIEFGIQHVAVDDDVEDALCATDNGGLANDVLIVSEKVGDRAHGVVRIVSTNAVLNADAVHRGSSDWMSRL